MTMEIATYLKFATVQMAAEARRLSEGISGTQFVDALDFGNNRTSKIPFVSAVEFSANWAVVASQQNTATGFSGTLFQYVGSSDATNGLVSGELVISFRSTEFADDAVRDNTATNALEISDRGWAFGQIADMEDWFAGLRASGKIPSASKVSVTGYSLGGHLATAFNILRREQGEANIIAGTYTFNGAGVGNIAPGLTLTRVIDDFRSAIAAPQTLVDGLVLAAPDAVAEAYRTMWTKYSGRDHGIPTLSEVSYVFALNEQFKGAAQALLDAVKGVREVMLEQERVAMIVNPGADGAGVPPSQVATSDIAAIDIGYQLAAAVAAKSTRAYPMFQLGDPESGIYSSRYDKRNTTIFPYPRFYDVYAANKPSAVANSQLHYGEATPVRVEDQPLHRGLYAVKVAQASLWNWDLKLLTDNFSQNDFGDTHSLALLVDSLAVQSAFARLDPTFSLAKGSALIDLATNATGRTSAPSQGFSEGDALENLVISLAAQLGVTTKPLSGNREGNTWYEVEDKAGYTGRAALDEALRMLYASDQFKALTGKVIVVPIDKEIDTQVKSRLDFEEVAALQSLSPFKFKPVSDDAKTALSSVWNSPAWHAQYQGWLADKDAIAQGDVASNFSDEWMKYRSEMLQWKLLANEKNVEGPIQVGAGVARKHYDDRLTAEQLDLGFVYPVLQKEQVVFGGEQTDFIVGMGLEDHLFGGIGDDFIDGRAGSDYIEGNSGADDLYGGLGNDTILGGTGNDTLSGEAGNDSLAGGQGDDAYRFDDAFGKDTVTDSDGNGSITINAKDLGQFKGAGKRGGYAFDLGGGERAGLAIIDFASSTTGYKAVIIKGTDTSNTITINNFDLDKALNAGYLGIKIDSKPDIALVRGGGPNYFHDIDASTDSLAGKSLAMVKNGAAHFSASLSKGASGAATMMLHVGGLAGKGLKVIFGDEIVEADGATIALAEGQTQVSFALVHDGDLDGDAAGSISVSYQSDGVSASSNTWSLTLEDSGETANTFMGDALARTETNGDQPMSRLGVGGATFDVVDPQSLYFVRDSQNNLVAGTTQPTLVPIYNDAHEVVGYGSVSSDDIEVRDNTLFGTSANDRIDGKTGDDLLAGNDGNDQIDGGTGSDMIAGGAGNDHIEGGEGDDFISSSADIQTDRQQLGPDDRWTNWGKPVTAVLQGRGAMWGVYPDAADATTSVWNGMGETRTDAQSDSIDAGDGDDWVMASWGDDRIEGGAGNDRLEGLAGDDIVEGGEGNDKLDGDGLLKAGYQDSVAADRHGSDFIDGGLGDDSIRGGGGSDNIFGGAGNDTIFADGSGASDSQTFVELAYQGEDYIDGEDGDDYAEGGGKDDTLYGGSGKDTLWGDTSAVNLKGSTATDLLAWGDDYLDGEDGDDTLYGGGGDDTLYGGKGKDQLLGDDGPALAGSMHGADYLDGEDGDDTLVGGGRDDTLFGGAGDDTLQGDAVDIGGEVHGGDYLDGEEGDDFLFGQGGSDQLFGGVGNDELQGDGAEVAVEFQGADLLDGGDGDDRLFGGAGDDALLGGAGADQMSGDDGNDTLTGGDGVDLLVGGSGDDVLQGGDAADRLYGGTGNDQLAGGAGNDDLNSGDGDDVLDGGVGDDRFGILGTQGTKVLRDESGTETLELGWKLRDTELGRGSLLLRNTATGQEVHVEGFDADDAAALSPIEQFVFAVDDDGTVVLSAEDLIRLVGFSGHGTDGDDVISGTAFHDVLAGGAGDDVLAGNEGDDRLAGGSGDNQLLGGLGDDVYVVDAQGQDEIIEFEDEGEDRIEASVDYVLAAANVETVLLTGHDAINATGGDGDDHLVGNGVANDLDGGAGADLLEGMGGDDTYRVDNAADVVVEQVSEGTDTVIASVSYVLPGEVDNLTLTGDASDATGNAEANRLQGNEADNRLRGMDGNDRLEGGGGSDVYVVRADSGLKTIFDSAGEQDVLDLGWNAYATHFVLGSSADRLGIFNASTRQLVEIEGFDPLAVDPVSSIEKMILFVPIFGGFEQAFYIDEIFREQGLSFFGTYADDTLTGTWRRDSLFGFQGDDTLLGTGGDDMLDGGTGRDRMLGADGDDLYMVDDAGDTVAEVAGEGFDTVLAEVDFSIHGTDVEWLEMTDTSHRTGIGNDLRNYMYASQSGSVLYAEGGNDEVFGRIGDDNLHGGAGNDHMLGRAGDDLLAGDDGDDELRADQGEDVLEGGSGSDQLFGGTGNDALDGGGGDDVLWGGEGGDLLEGGAGNDMLRGEAGQDVLSGGDGDDTLLNSPGADTLAGGAGDDIYREDTVNGLIDGFAASGTRIVEELDGGTDTVIVYESFTLGDNLENLTLLHRDAEIPLEGIGNTLDNRLENFGIGSASLFGGDGDDMLVGGHGDNFLDGGVGADLMTGGTGRNEYMVDDFGDRVVALANGGDDTVHSSLDFVLGEFVENLILEESSATIGTGNDLTNRITGNSNDNVLDGGAGSDAVLGGAGNDILIGTQGHDSLQGEAGDDLLLGGDTGTAMFGGAGSDQLFGGAGADDLIGGTEADTMVGGAGDDLYAVDDAGDLVIEDADGGTDSVVAFVDYTLSDALENLTVEGFGLTGIGNARDNVVRGDQGGESLFGLDGDDLLDAGAGVGAMLDGGAGRDTLVSARGWATLAGGDGDDLYRLATGNVDLVELAAGGYDRVVVDAGEYLQVGLYLSDNVEELDASAMGGNLFAQAGRDDNIIVSGAGNDDIDGGAGNDRIFGGHSKSATIFEQPGAGIAGAMEEFFRMGQPVLPTFTRLLADFSGEMSQDPSQIIRPAEYVVWKTPASPGDAPERVPFYVADGYAGNDAGQALFIHPDGSLTWEGGGTLQDLLETWTPHSGPLGWDELQAQYGLRTSVPAAERDAYFAVSGNRIPSPERLDNGWTGGDYATVYWPRDRVPDGMLAKLAAQLGSDEAPTELALALAGTGNDHLVGGDGDDFLDGGDGNDLLSGGEGEDLLVGGDGHGAVSVSVLGGTEGDFVSVVVASGEPTNDDVLDGGGGIDTLIGGSGDDTYYVDGLSTPNSKGRVALFDWCDVEHRFGMDGTALETWVADTVVEDVDQGNDRVIASASVVLANIETVELSDIAPNLDIDATTGTGAQTLIGNGGRNTLDGGAGADVMAGGAGDDTYLVDDAGDVIDEGVDGGQDIVRTTLDQYVLGDNLEALLLDGSANLSAFGNAASNVLIGNRGDNVLDGGVGDDYLAGWRGDDFLRGGEGYDYYVFGRGDGHDTVEDATGELHFSGDIRYEELSFSADAYDLQIRVGATDGADGVQVTIADWLRGDVGRMAQMSFCTDGVVGPIEERLLMQAQADAFTMAAGATTVAGNLLDNDAAAVLRDRLRMYPASWVGRYGTAVADENGAFEYTLDPDTADFHALAEGQAGTDALNPYTAFDVTTGLWTGTVDVQVSVTGVNDAPAAEVDFAWANEDLPFDVAGNVLDNDTDIDQDELVVSNPQTQLGAFGILEIAASGDYRYVLDNDSLAVQSLGWDGWVTDLFQYVTVDSHGAEALGTLAIDVFGNNDAPVGSDDAVECQAGGPAALGNVLANDSDIDVGDVLTLVNPGSSAGMYGALELTEDGGFSYSLDNGSAAVQALAAGQKVNDVFAYTVADAHGATATAQLAVEISGAAESSGVTLKGTERNDRLVGTDGADVIDGAKGADTMVGAGGDDIYFVDAASLCDGEHDDHDDESDGDGHDRDVRHSGDREVEGRDDHHEEEDCNCNPGDSVVELSSGGIDTVAASVNYVLPQNVENLMLLGTAARTGSGNGLANVIVGSGGSSTLSGAAGNDVLVGRSANDTLRGDAGNDRLYGEGGSDKLEGGQGSDQLWGGSGQDVLDGGDGDNLLAAGAGEDTLKSGSGSDVVVAGAGSDRITAGSGNDFIDAGAGSDTIDAGAGSDFIAAGKGSDTVTSGADRDVVAFNRGDGQDTLLATSGSSADVLSLGGGIRYADLTLNRRGTDLILGMGAADQITSKNWYAGQDGKGVATLQIVTVGGDYNAASANKLVASKVVAFDFTAITQQYDAARKANASLGLWALQPALNAAFIGGSNTSALGGDLAFDYATTYTASLGYGADMTVEAVRSEVKEQLGTNWQAITVAPSGPSLVDPWVALQAGTDLVVSNAPGASNPVTPTSSPMTDSLLLAALAGSSEIQQPTWAAK